MPEIWKCQFCGGEYPDLEWIGGGDTCPACENKYDPILAQEGDD